MKSDTKNESAYLFVILLALFCLLAQWTGHNEPPLAMPAPAKESPLGTANAVASVIRGEKLDLNRVGADELRLVPGVGGKTADEVIRYRERHGAFQTVEELVRVKGIGSKTVARLAGWLEVR